MELTLEKIFTIFLSLMISVALIIPVYSITVRYFGIMKTEVEINNFISLTNKTITTVYNTQNNLSDVEIFYPGNITIQVENNSIVFRIRHENKTTTAYLVYSIKIKLLQMPITRGKYFLSVYYINHSNHRYILVSYDTSK